MPDRRIAIDLRLGGRKGALAAAEIEDRAPAVDLLPQRLRQCVPGRGGAGEFGIAQGQAVQVGNFERVEHRPARRPRRVAHVAVPVLAGATDADRPAVLGDVGDHDDLRAARHAPAFAEDVEFDLAEAAGEGNLLRRGDVLVAKEDDAMFVVGPLDRGERRVVDGPARSTPRISAPSAAPVGMISMDMDGPLAGRRWRHLTMRGLTGPAGFRPETHPVAYHGTPAKAEPSAFVRGGLLQSQTIGWVPSARRLAEPRGCALGGASGSEP